MSYYLTHITYPILFVAVLARQLCLPVPALLFLLTGGALAGSGKLNFVGILMVAVLGCLLADFVWFEAGRLRGKRVLRLLCALTSDPSFCIRRGREVFSKKGLRLLLIAKFVPGLPEVRGLDVLKERTQFLPSGTAERLNSPINAQVSERDLRRAPEFISS